MNRLLAVGIGLTLVIGACDGSEGADRLSLNEYFDRLQVLSGEAAETADQSGDDGGPSSAAFERDLAAGNFDAIAVGFNQGLDVFRDFLIGIRDLNPPSEAQSAHDALLGALDDFIDSNENLVAQIEDAQTETGFTAIFDNAPPEADAAPIGQACRRLQQVATDNNLSVDLDCGNAE